MSWNAWRRPDFDDDDLTEYEKAQVRAMQDAVRQYEEDKKKYDGLIYWLASRIVPGDVDHRLSKDPFAFANMSPTKWRSFFEATLHDLYLTRGPAPIVQPLKNENARLRQRIADLEAQIAEIKAERDRLQETVIVHRRTNSNATVSGAAKSTDDPAPEPEEEQQALAPLHLSFHIPDAYPQKYASLFHTDIEKKMASGSFLSGRHGGPGIQR